MREIKFRAYHPQTKKMLYDGSEWKFRVGTHLIEKVITVLHYGVMHNVPAGGNHDYVKVVDKEGVASNYYSNWDYEAVYQSVEIMQYVGFRDKNGKEIFEGDIVSMHQFLFEGTEVEKEHIGIIEWMTSDDSTGGGIAAFGVRIVKGDYIREYTSCEDGDFITAMHDFHGLHEESFEVIGNIYEHPFLLQDKGEA